MEIIIGVVSILVTVIISLYSFYNKKHAHRPELALEIISRGGMSSPLGLSPKNKPNAEGYIDGNNAIRFFELTWRFKLIITNNSDYNAYYPKIRFIQSKPRFTRIDNLNELKPLKSTESIELKAEYLVEEECKGSDRTEVGLKIPDKLKGLKILIESQNGKKMKIDRFTKIVLTVIAINLTFLTVKDLDLIPKAYANEPTNNLTLATSPNYGLVPLNEDGSINVRLSNSEEIDVNITDISTYDKLNVHLKSSNSYSLQYAGPLEVEMD